MAEQEKSRFQTHHPAGIYQVKVIGQALAESATKKTPYLALKVEVLRLKKATDGKSYNLIPNAHRFVNLYLTNKTAEYVAPFLEAAGFKKGTSLTALDPAASNHFSLVGFEFDASCKQEKAVGGKNDGKIFDRFEPLPIKSSTAWMDGLNRPNSGKMLQLDAIFGSQLSGTVTTKPLNVEKSAPADSFFPDPEDSDIPF